MRKSLSKISMPVAIGTLVIALTPQASAIDTMTERHERCEKKDCSAWEQIWNEEIQDVYLGMECGVATFKEPWNLDEKCFEKF
ncbi:hypothetical protein V5S96_10390 [Corynebacterium mastitidis]|uniref:Uncharacterized protein n=1 Tax=Corynebacterium mastitidis TaxID=161890 RepID=A0ABU8P0H8_9CORY